MWRARVCSGMRWRHLPTNAALAMGVTTWTAGVLTHARCKHHHGWSVPLRRECHVVCLEKTTCPAHMREVILDTDCSLDDFAAIALLWKSDIEVVLVTTVRGGCKNSVFGAEMMRRFWRKAGQGHVPVIAGCAVLPDGFKEPSWIDGHLDKLKVAALTWGVSEPKIDEPAPKMGLEHEAGLAIAEKIKELSNHGRGVTILALGPLTNIACALSKLPSWVNKSTIEVVFAGDLAMKYSTDGRRTLPFNVRADEESFKAVLQSEVDVRLVRPLNIPPSWNPMANCRLDQGCKEALNFSVVVVRFFAAAPRYEVHLRQDTLVALLFKEPVRLPEHSQHDLNNIMQYCEGAKNVQRINKIDMQAFEAWLKDCAMAH